jgi:polyphosphate kinase
MKDNLINKEVSWLSFNERVLQEAANPSVPLIERIKFLGICSSNLDEFYRVRVATLTRISRLGKKAKKIIGDDPEKVLEEIRHISLKQHKQFDQIYENILKELAAHNIFILNETQLNEDQGKFVKSYFYNEVRPRLFPIMLDQIQTFPELKDRAIYLAVLLTNSKEKKKPASALIEIPSDVLPRFLVLPRVGQNRFVILLDDIIRFGLFEIFAIFKYDQSQAYTIKITRDAELDIEDDLSESYIRKIVKSLKQRKGANPVRFIHDSEMPEELRSQIFEKLNLRPEDTVIAGSRYHNNRDFISFPVFDGKQYTYKPITAIPHKEILPDRSMLKAISEKDILLHFPYQSFDNILDLLREASIDPKVISIKITIYRVAKNSSVMNALINAAKNGKTVIAVLELQARFDEEANVFWANRLQEDGVRVIFGVPGLKVHSKLILINRTEGRRISRYAVIGTGNFNEDTATIYSDHNILTADKRYTREVHKMFEFFENNYKTNIYKHFIVSPFNSRTKMATLIQNEIKNAQKGIDALITLKINNLSDALLIKKLYDASRAGVKIRLIIRGMFSLIPGKKNLSENIEAISIVDKFLEHSRIFIFANAGQAKYYISSADWMPRNIDRRIETITPVYDPALQQELQNFIDIQWQDNERARILDEKLRNQFKNADGKKKVRCQWAIYDYLKSLHMKP